MGLRNRRELLTTLSRIRILGLLRKKDLLSLLRVLNRLVGGSLNMNSLSWDQEIWEFRCNRFDGRWLRGCTLN